MSSSELGSVATATASAYDTWSANYDTCENVTRDLDAVALRSVGLDLSGRRVAEFGCGTGRHTEYFLRKHPDLTSYVAFDVSTKMQEVARSRIAESPEISEETRAKVQFVIHDSTRKWPLRDGGVDVLFGDLVLEHLEKLDFFFAEAARTLSPGGTLCVCELHPVKQYMGVNARFDGCKTAEVVAPPCFTHDVSEFVRAGVASGLVVADMKEFRDVGHEQDKVKPPRILTIIFKKKAE